MKLVRIAMLTMAVAFGGTLTGCAGDSTHRSTAAAADDGYISTKVKTAILADEGLKGNDVKVETYRGIVQLSGFVDNAEQASRAVSIAEKVSGVKSVKNDMRIKPAAEATGANTQAPSGSAAKQ
jgi:hyperosmotically inducible periplasmic protein